MKKCRFLETRRSREGGPAYYCGVGVNFFSVEENRRLCRTCPLNDLGDMPLCEHLEAYTFLKSNSERQGLVRVEFHCDLLYELLDGPNVCATCLHYQARRVCEDRVPWPPVFQVGNR
jgi:hypothetical protein